MRNISRFAAIACMSSVGALSIVVLSSLSASAAIAISSTATQNMSCSHGLCQPTAEDAVLNVDDLTAMLARGNVEVSTGSGTLASEVEDILVVSGFSWSSKHSLELDAYRSISFQAGAVAVNGKGAVALVTNDGATDGQLSFQPGANLSFASTNNHFWINSRPYTLENSIAALAGGIAANPQGAFALANNYDASQDGIYHSSPIDTPLWGQGKVEGLGHAISNLSIITPPTIGHIRQNEIYIGLFSQIQGGFGTVSDLSLTNLNYHISNYYASVGGLAGGLEGYVTNVHASGSIRSVAEVTGGLVGENGASITSSHASVNIDITSQYLSAAAGGLVGTNGGVIELSSATGSVHGTSAYLGGLAGDTEFGGIIQCFASGAVRGSAQEMGGLFGAAGDTSLVEDSYATGPVKNRADPDSPSNTGGLGGGETDLLGPEISHSYSTGFVSGGKYIGGSIGGYVGEAISSYWNTATSKTDQGVGEGGPRGLVGLTSRELRFGLPGGFDPAIWRETKGINHGFPYLINNLPTEE